MAVDSVKTRGETNAVARKKIKDSEENLERQNIAQRREVARIREENSKEIRKLKEQYEGQMDEMRDKMRESLTGKDKAYQTQIHDMEENNNHQLKKVNEEGYAKLARERDAYQKEKAKFKDITVSKNDRLVNGYKDQIKEQDKRNSNLAGYYQKSQEEAIAENTKSLNEAHKEERDSIIQDRDRHVFGLKHDINALKRSKDDQILGMQINSDMEKQNANAKFEDTIRNERKMASSTLESAHSQQAQSVSQVKEKYQKAVEDYRREADAARNEFRKNVNDRIQDRILALQSRMRDLETEKITGENKARVDHRMEMDTLKGAMQKNINLLEESRINQIETSRDLHAKDIQSLTKDRDTMLHEQRVFMDEKRAQDKIRDQERFNNQVSTVEHENKKLASESDARANRLMNYSQKERAAVETYYTETIDQMKKQHEQDLKDLRFMAMSQNNKTQTRLEDHLRSTEEKFGKQSEDMIQKYEMRIADIERKSEIDKRRLVKEYDRRYEQLNKAQMENFKNMQTQYQDTIETLKKQQSEELERQKARFAKEKEELVKSNPKV